MTSPEPQQGANAAPPQDADEAQVFRARARRAPRITRFLILGGFVGAVVAFILTLTHSSVASGQDDTSVDGSLGVGSFVIWFFCMGVGVALGAVVALVLDRVSARRVSVVTVERGIVDAPEGADADADAADAPAADAAPAAHPTAAQHAPTPVTPARPAGAATPAPGANPGGTAPRRPSGF